MFRIGDRVVKRYYDGAKNKITGTVVAVNGRWIHVKHDRCSNGRLRGVDIESDRFDYAVDELEHTNQLLKFAQALWPDDRSGA
jgi:hypothetical protein